MVICLIGMSGVGKSYWAAKLADQGCTVFDCDALIAAKLQQQVTLPGTSLADVGRWMGFPDEPGFLQREARYLQCENEILQDILDTVSDPQRAPGTSVIDTSGSVIYVAPALLQRLQEQTTVVYFRIPETLYPAMLASYLAHPRPLVWNGLFHQNHDEQRSAAFRRSYGQLIRHRAQRYEQYSDIHLEYHEYRKADFQALHLLQLVGSMIETQSRRSARADCPPAAGDS
jgi:shikimate kinase